MSFQWYPEHGDKHAVWEEMNSTRNPSAEILQPKPCPFWSLSPQGHNTCPPDTGCVCSVVVLKGFYYFKEKTFAARFCQLHWVAWRVWLIQQPENEHLRRGRYWLLSTVLSKCPSGTHFQCFPGLEACVPLVAPPGKWAVTGSAQQTSYTQLTSLSRKLISACLLGPQKQGFPWRLGEELHSLPNTRAPLLVVSSAH